MLKRQQWKKWIDAGILLVHKVCHAEENRLLGQNEIVEQFNIKCNFLEAMSVRSSIPYEWCSRLSVAFRETFPSYMSLSTGIKNRSLPVKESAFLALQVRLISPGVIFFQGKLVPPGKSSSLLVKSLLIPPWDS